MTGYSIIAPGVSVENFGAGKGQSRLQRFTSGLYANLNKSDDLDKRMMDQRSRKATQPYADRAAIAKSRAESLAHENKTLIAMTEMMGNICRNNPGSAQCLAWKDRVNGVANKVEQMKKDVTDATALDAQVKSNAASTVLPNEADGTAAVEAQLQQIELDRQAEEDKQPISVGYYDDVGY